MNPTTPTITARAESHTVSALVTMSLISVGTTACAFATAVPARATPPATTARADETNSVQVLTKLRALSQQKLKAFLMMFTVDSAADVSGLVAASCPAPALLRKMKPADAAHGFRRMPMAGGLQSLRDGGEIRAGSPARTVKVY